MFQPVALCLNMTAVRAYEMTLGRIYYIFYYAIAAHKMPQPVTLRLILTAVRD